MRIFLAGSTGVLGRRLVPLLVGGGHQVTALTRRPDEVGSLRAAGAEPVLADALDKPSILRAVGDAAPDVVIHQLTDLAAGTSASNAALRRLGTRNLVDAAHGAGVRRMIAQSIAWVYEAGEQPAGEQTPLDLHSAEPRVTSVLGVAALEEAVAEIAEWVVLRYGLLYGPDTWYTRGGLRAADAQAGRLPADDDVSSFVHVDDAATAAVEALGWPSGPVNICDDEPAAGRDWVPVFCRAVGAPPPEAANDTTRTPWARGADNRHARSELAWVPQWPSWRKGFAALRVERPEPSQSQEVQP